MAAERLRSILSKDHFVNIRGKEYITIGGMLAMAHAYGYLGQEVEIRQVADKANGMRAVVKVAVTLQDREANGAMLVVSAIGDADPQTTKLEAYERIAETRALARALRFALNWGDVTAEEMPSVERGDRGERKGKDATAAGAGKPVAPRYNSIEEAQAAEEAKSAQAPKADGSGPPECSEPGCGKPLTKGQAMISERGYGRPLCPTHQQSAQKLG